MLAIISWILIDLFGPIPKYKLTNAPSADLNSREYLQQLEALSASRIEPHTHVEALPNGVNFYEAEIAAIKTAKQKGFRVNINCTLFDGAEPESMRSR